jgi:hypothetical protein
MRNGDCVELNGKTIEEDAKEFRIVGHAQLFHIQLLKQSIPPISFVFPAFSVLLRPLFLLIGRS